RLLQEGHNDYDETSAENLPDEDDGEPGWSHDYVLSLTASPPSSPPRHEEGGVNGGRASKRPRLTSSSSSSGVMGEVPFKTTTMTIEGINRVWPWLTALLMLAGTTLGPGVQGPLRASPSMAARMRSAAPTRRVSARSGGGEESWRGSRGHRGRRRR